MFWKTKQTRSAVPSVSAMFSCYSHDPKYLQENFKGTRNRKQQHARNTQWNFAVPNVKRNVSRTTIHINAIKDSNNLPNDLKACKKFILSRRE